MNHTFLSKSTAYLLSALGIIIGVVLTSSLMQHILAQGTSTDVLINPLGGNVGIGTTTPAETLDVAGNIKSSGTVCDGSGNCLDTVSGDGGGADNDWIISGDNMSSAVSGNVGIGTENPGAALAVQGNFTQPLTGTITIPGGSTAVTGVGTLFTTELTAGESFLLEQELVTVASILNDTQLQLTAAITTGIFKGTGYIGGDIVQLRDSGGQEKGRVDKHGNISAVGTICDGSGNCLDTVNGGGSSYSLDAIDGSPTEAVYVNGAGHVGIGNTSPGELLEVNGRTRTDDLTVDAHRSCGKLFTDSAGNVLCGEDAPDVVSGTGGPIGTVVLFAGAVPPIGWMSCDGTEVSRTDFSELFGVIGTVYGAGDGTTTFNIPDLQGRVAVGHGFGTGLSPRTLGQMDGEEEHLLTVDEMPAHGHPPPPGDRAYVTRGGEGGHSGIPAGSIDYEIGANVTGSTGGGQAHNTMQPYTVMNFIIRAF